MEWSSVKRNVLISFMIFLLSVTSAWAQTGTASLRGTVTDKTGASVGDAKVSLDNLGQALHREEMTSTTGAYEFVGLLPGTYALVIEKAGFRTCMVSGKVSPRSVRVARNSFGFYV